MYIYVYIYIYIYIYIYKYFTTAAKIYLHPFQRATFSVSELQVTCRTVVPLSEALPSYRNSMNHLYIALINRKLINTERKSLLVICRLTAVTYQLQFSQSEFIGILNAILTRSSRCPTRN